MTMCPSYVRWVLTFSFFFVGSVGTQGPVDEEVHCPFIFYNNICSNSNWGISDLGVDPVLFVAHMYSIQ